MSSDSQYSIRSIRGVVDGGMIVIGDGATVGTVAGFVSSGIAASAATVLVAYLRQHKADLKLRITRQDGTELEVDAQRIKDPEAFTRQLLEALDTVEASAGDPPDSAPAGS